MNYESGSSYEIPRVFRPGELRGELSPDEPLHVIDSSLALAASAIRHRWTRLFFLSLGITVFLSVVLYFNYDLLLRFVSSDSDESAPKAIYFILLFLILYRPFLLMESTGLILEKAAGLGKRRINLSLYANNFTVNLCQVIAASVFLFRLPVFIAATDIVTVSDRLLLLFFNKSMGKFHIFEPTTCIILLGGFFSAALIFFLEIYMMIKNETLSDGADAYHTARTLVLLNKGLFLKVLSWWVVASTVILWVFTASGELFSSYFEHSFGELIADDCLIGVITRSFFYSLFFFIIEPALASVALFFIGMAEMEQVSERPVHEPLEASSNTDVKVAFALFVGSIVLFLLALVSSDNTGLQADEQLRRCRSNLRMLEAAAELARLESGDRSEALSIEKLVRKGYLKSRPVCPADGKYCLIFSNGKKKELRARCTKHGTLDD